MQEKKQRKMAKNEKNRVVGKVRRLWGGREIRAKRNERGGGERRRGDLDDKQG